MNSILIDYYQKKKICCEITTKTCNQLQPINNLAMFNVDNKLLLEMSEKLDFIYINTLKKIAHKELKGLKEDIEAIKKRKNNSVKY